MSKADEMFKELGYSKIGDRDVCYGKRDEIGGVGHIEFWYDFKKVNMFYRDSNSNTTNTIIDMKVLQAINMKCKELNWI